MFLLTQSEKAYNLQTQNVYLLGLNNTKITVNKTIILKALTDLKLEPIDVNSHNTYYKSKRKGKKFTTIKQKRPKKFYIKLAANKKIDEENLTQINEKIFNSVTTNK